MGHGPVDLFGTRFNQYFMPEAHGTICGHPVDREGIKQGLLNLQKRWNTEEVKVTQDCGRHGFPLRPSVVRRFCCISNISHAGELIAHLHS